MPHFHLFQMLVEASALCQKMQNITLIILLCEVVPGRHSTRSVAVSSAQPCPPVLQTNCNIWMHNWHITQGQEGLEGKKAIQSHCNFRAVGEINCSCGTM